MQTNFTAGELSPRMFARVDVAKYQNGVETLENMIVQKHGPASRRGGTYFTAEVKDSAAYTRLIPFEFSVTQAYILEFGNEYIRFYKNYGRVETGPFSEEFSSDFNKGGAYEIASPYLTADLSSLVITQSADVLYIAHPNYPPRKLSRLGDTNWTLTEIDFSDGPFNFLNATNTTLTLSGTTGSVTVTASAATGINNDQGFP